MRLMILILPVAILLLVGCEQGGGDGKLPFSYENIHTGTDGVKIEFLSNSPPSELPAPFKSGNNYPFKAAIKASNKGAFDVENGVIAMTVENDYIAMDEVSKQFSLKGKSVFNPLGDSDIIVLSATTKKFREGQAEKHKTLMIAEACYKYRTEVKAETCIDTDVLGVTTKKKTCAIKEMTFSGQGAPLVVNKIEPKIFPEGGSERIEFVKPSFVIHVRNAGDGQVVNPNFDIASICTSDFAADRNSDFYRRVYNVVDIKATLSGVELECSPRPLRLTGKEDFVRCSVKDDGKISASTPSYIAPLYISLDYGYASTVSKEVTLVKEVFY